MSTADTLGAPAARLAARRPWQLRAIDEQAANRLRTTLGLSSVAARVLAGRGIETSEAAEAFLEPSLAGLHDPFLFADMEAAVDRLLYAIRCGERIVVHGDYDVDGITSTVLLIMVLRHLGADAEFVLPHRIDDGYGLNPSGIDKATEVGAQVLICVDCGITAHEACALAKQRGIDVIVVDHHIPRTELPEAAAILNPRVEGSGYPEEDLAAVGVAFKLARALLARHVTTSSGLSMLKLVALGTVADLVPLHGENRVMTFHGLASLAGAVNPGLIELMKVAGVDARSVTAGDVGFRLAPRINAAGRIGHPGEAAELFLTGDPGRARRLAGHLQRLNTRRQELERSVYDQAVESGGSGDDPIVLVWGEGWHRGVIGIVASRLVERWGRPAVVASVDEGVAHGSARSVPGFNIVEALNGAAELLGRYGGHKQAAGFELPASNLPALAEVLGSNARNADPSSLRAVLTCDDRLEARDVSVSLVHELERLAPFGIGNPRPRFVCEGARLAGPPQLLKEAHTKLRLRADEGDVEAVAWRRPELASALAGIDEISVVATLKPRRWGGRVVPQLEIQDLCA